MTTKIAFETASDSNAILLFIEKREIIARITPPELGSMITVTVSVGSNHRLPTAWVAQGYDNPEAQLRLWRREGMMFITTEEGDAASMLELMIDLTEAFAQDFTALVIDRFSTVEWDALGRFPGSPHSAMVTASEPMTFDRFEAERQQYLPIDDWLVLTLRDGTTGLMWSMPQEPGHLIGVELRDGRQIKLPLDWVVRLDGKTAENWPPVGEGYRFCSCSTEHRQITNYNRCMRCGYQVMATPLTHRGDDCI